MDPLSVVIGAAAGVAGGGIVAYLFSRVRPTKAAPKGSEALPRRTVSSKSVQSLELDRSRRDLRSVVLEKDVLSSAITRVYEAEAEGRITRDEREKLVSKYREQLRSVEDKLGDLSLIIEVGELENLRGELVNLFERKIGQIESRLSEAKVHLEGVKRPVPPPAEQEAPAKVEEKRAEKKRPKGEAQADERVKALRDEVLDALARLEQMDMEA